MPITTKNLKVDDLEDILGDDEEELEEELEEEELEEEFEEEIEEEEEVEEVKPVKKKKFSVKKVKKTKPSEYSYVTLVGATSYSVRGKTYRINEPTKVSKHELEYFKNNGWFAVR